MHHERTCSGVEKTVRDKTEPGVWREDTEDQAQNE